MFCIDTQYTERYIDKHLYRYCVNHGGITANASSSKKGIGFLLDMRGDARLVPETRSPFRSEAL